MLLYVNVSLLIKSFLVLQLHNLSDCEEFDGPKNMGSLQSCYLSVSTCEISAVLEMVKQISALRSSEWTVCYIFTKPFTFCPQGTNVESLTYISKRTCTVVWHVIDISINEDVDIDFSLCISITVLASLLLTTSLRALITTKVACHSCVACVAGEPSSQRAVMENSTVRPHVSLYGDRHRPDMTEKFEELRSWL